MFAEVRRKDRILDDDGAKYLLEKLVSVDIPGKTARKPKYSLE